LRWTRLFVFALVLVAAGLMMTNVVLTLTAGGTYSATCTVTGAAWQDGTVAPAPLPADTNITFTAAASSGPPDAPSPGGGFRAAYTNLTASTLDFSVDLDNDTFEGPFVAMNQ
jgi:hypothetical protein